ncbi:MAG: hypothetical protein ACKVIG_12290 [Flavobacteriales bacterium]
MKIIKKTLFILFISSIILTSCEKEEYNQPIQEKIKGKWKLTGIVTVGKNGPDSFNSEDFSEENIIIDINNNVSIKENFELHVIGNYDFVIKFENYFDSTKFEAPNYNIIEFDNQKYVIEIGNNENGRLLKLTSYSDFQKTLHFEERK